MYLAAHLQGFLAGDFAGQQERFMSDMTRWLGEGALGRYKEDISQGLEALPEAFCKLFTGENFGKAAVQLCDDPSRAGAEA